MLKDYKNREFPEQFVKLSGLPPAFLCFLWHPLWCRQWPGGGSYASQCNNMQWCRHQDLILQLSLSQLTTPQLSQCRVRGIPSSKWCLIFRISLANNVVSSEHWGLATFNRPPTTCLSDIPPQTFKKLNLPVLIFFIVFIASLLAISWRSSKRKSFCW